jgi:hypothetical protein
VGNGDHDGSQGKVTKGWGREELGNAAPHEQVRGAFYKTLGFEGCYLKGQTLKVVFNLL